MSDPIKNEWQKLVQDSRKDAAAPPPPPPPPPPPLNRRTRWVIPALFVLSLGALALWLEGSVNPWPADPTATELEAGRAATLVVAARAIQDYARFHGRYPAQIEDVLPLSLDIQYRIVQDGFELMLDAGDGSEPLVLRGR